MKLCWTPTTLERDKSQVGEEDEARTWRKGVVTKTLSDIIKRLNILVPVFSEKLSLGVTDKMEEEKYNCFVRSIPQNAVKFALYFDVLSIVVYPRLLGHSHVWKALRSSWEVLRGKGGWEEGKLPSGKAFITIHRRPARLWVCTCWEISSIQSALCESQAGRRSDPPGPFVKRCRISRLVPVLIPQVVAAKQWLVWSGNTDARLREAGD